MRVLALDTATPYLVLGLNQAERAVRLERRHAEALWTELEAFLADCHTPLKEIEGIAVGRGPGSYTGLRIGISAGLGLARGLGIPAVGVDTLVGVAMRYKGPVTVAHTTRNGLAYAATYVIEEGIKELRPPRRIPLEQLEPEGAFSLNEPPSGQALAHLGNQALRMGKRGIQAVYL
ncbi:MULTISPECIES: tRNA (adenosine(37)-N6)-threonylcarbamoyltransferase complex dimerization subunit type 1 TsaB [unclassified Meiothermus]|uniref:tRNA (adenosine(37)-N6)-threonylcarbamoyltransferase complex dimerization subunit type 1 TsaB n=1 Tax=unclassified Meiothermus TaxID=370471 RepID=UPI000D7CE60C|nr:MULTISPECIES: tRNA (adenosine(37)-N6)-threonylcarbamoyltransferase complex dimerization subunit type 1 TsaB [unclassified Meiothermus]PZA08034.1 tRNA (adenosine(37)-N6)-threonylcarbamoyltransferase complex dimerization subunit type 1 TsaB [Meiothermus sp. Pnk-1]RYM32718.1 tRNA (adenosine(37)-N6)-threonylcarbamoyltransferase complex dimerization subunit type 1 TsaB [Meiothermus sp. PNK-Is4]